MDVTPAEITLVRGGLCAGVATGAEQDLQSLPQHNRMIKYHYPVRRQVRSRARKSEASMCLVHSRRVPQLFSEPSRLKTRRNGHRDRRCVRIYLVHHEQSNMPFTESAMCVTIVIMRRVRASKGQKGHRQSPLTHW